MSAVQFVAPEDLARANFWGLLARLFYAPPDTGLLAELAKSGPLQGEDPSLPDAWRALCEAAGTADVEAIREEFDSTFVGTGKAPITLYSTAYTIKYSNEAPLAELRGELARLGLARRQDVSEPEDHIAALCDVLRFLIAQQQSPLDEQKQFFQRWIAPAFHPLCAAIERSERTRFYKHVARLAECFCTVEHRSFEML